MPLVTRQTISGRIFKQADEPADWQNGDIWVDTDNGQTFVNIAGTATNIGAGALNQGDILISDADDSLTTLAKGTADQVLTMNSGATLPEWQELSGTKRLLWQSMFHGQRNGSCYTPVQGYYMDDTGNQNLIGDLTEADVRYDYSQAFTVKRMVCNLTLAVGTSSDLIFRDDGADRVTLDLGTTTGDKDTGTVTGSVAANSLINLEIFVGTTGILKGVVSIEVDL